ncbi:MAG: hypothetical protein DRJ65_11950 [Acidobacteria bacterium]|nr:MAG: hypothetical protein DRJ65_11950 [Acidobacteriota bacterium]
MKHPLLSLVVFLLLAATPANAGAPCGAVICLSELAADEALRVTDLVAAGRAEHAIAFEGLARVRASVPELDAAKRGRYALVGPYLARLGGGGVPAILERLVLADAGPETLNPSARTAWRIGLLDTIGKLRDPRAAAVLVAVCRSPRAEGEMLRVASAALGRLETDSAAAVLVELSREPGERGQAILAGMGHCRRLLVVRRLAEALPEQTDAATHRDVARSLATAASAPVWRAGLVRYPEEGREIRSLAARALFDDFVARSDDQRKALVTALLVVDQSATSGLLEQEKTDADPALSAALDHLAKRLECNPISRFANPE